jgi:hypothetical protein
METVIAKHKFRDASSGEPMSQIIPRKQVDSVVALAEPPRTLHNNAALPRCEDEFGVFEHKLYALCKVNRNREAIAEALDYFDDRLIAGRFRECAGALRQLQVTKLAPSVMVSILGITVWAKILKGRAIFFDSAFHEIARQKGSRYASELLAKYR